MDFVKARTILDENIGIPPTKIEVFKTFLC
jgi:hypothetical protein